MLVLPLFVAPKFYDLLPVILASVSSFPLGITAHFELDENPEHLKLINAINLIIDEYNLILKMREGGKDAADPDNDRTDSE